MCHSVLSDRVIASSAHRPEVDAAVCRVAGDSVSQRQASSGAVGPNTSLVSPGDTVGDRSGRYGVGDAGRNFRLEDTRDYVLRPDLTFGDARGDRVRSGQLHAFGNTGRAGVERSPE